MAYQAPYSGLAQLMEMQGRGPDTRLVHMTPMELRTLQAMSPTGRLTTNPETGLPEAGILEDILPIVLPIAGAVAAPYLLPAVGLTGLSGVAAGAIGTGVGSTLGGLAQGKGLGESLIQGGLSGLMSYGLGSAFSPATAAAPQTAAGVPTAPTPDLSTGISDPITGAAIDPNMELVAGLPTAPTPSPPGLMAPNFTTPDPASVATLNQSLVNAGAGTPTSELGAFLGTSDAVPYTGATDVFAPVAQDAGMIGKAKYDLFTSTPDFLGKTAVGGSALGPTQLPTYGTAGTAALSGAMAAPVGQGLGLMAPDVMPFGLEYDEYYPYFDADLEGGRQRGRARARMIQRPPAFSSPAELRRMATTGGFGTFLAADGGRVPMDLNINGEPHQLSYINQDEADLLRSLGGAGQNVMGIPAYFDAGEGTAGEGAPDDGSGVGAAADGSDSAPGTDMGLGGYSDETAAAVQDAMDTMSDMSSVGMDPMGVVGNVNTFSMDPSQSNTMGVGVSQNLQVPIPAPPPNIGPFGRGLLGFFGLQPKGFTVNPNMTYQEHTGIGVPGVTNAALSAMGLDTSLGTISSPTMSPGGGDVDDGADSTEGAGDDPYYRPYGDPYNTGTAMAQGGVVQAGIGGLLKSLSPAYMFTQKPEMFSPAYMLAKKPEMLSPAYMMAKNPEMMSPAYMAAKGKSPIETVMKNMGMAQGGGISSLAYGGDPAPVGFANKAFEGMVPGPGTGMSDDVPFSIEGNQPALLSRDEYVLPADVVSQLGDGSSSAGADMLDNFISQVRQTKYGNTQQPAPVGPQLMTGLMRQGGVV